MHPQNLKADRSRGNRGFTLIELLLVVALIAVISAMLLPALAAAKRRAQQRAEAAATRPAQVYAPVERTELPTGPHPVIDTLIQDLALTSSSHLIGMEVYTRYQVTARGNIVLRPAPNPNTYGLLLAVPFPDDAL